MIKPSIGRVVWYWPTVAERTGGIKPVSASNDQPLAATVAFVHSDRMVNLSVVDANGVQFGRTSVPLLQEGDARPEGGYFAEWMPYQVGQAKKHEAEAEAETESFDCEKPKESVEQ